MTMPAPDTSGLPHAGGPDEARPDGRRLRRDRNAETVIDGFLSLFAEGRGFPTAQEVAERSGVSLRSVFRYFEDLDELVAAAVRVQIERYAEQLAWRPPPVTTPLADRIEFLIAERLERYDQIGHMFSMGLARAGRTPQIAAILEEQRAEVRPKLAGLFAPELDALDPATADAVLGAVHNTTLFEGYRNLVDRHGMDRARIANVFRVTLTAVFAPAR